MKTKLIESQHSGKKQMPFAPNSCRDALDTFLTKGVYDTSTHRVSFLESDYRLGEPNTVNFGQVQ